MCQKVSEKKNEDANVKMRKLQELFVSLARIVRSLFLPLPCSLSLSLYVTVCLAECCVHLFSLWL